MTPISPKIFFSILGGTVIIFFAVWWAGQEAQPRDEAQNHLSVQTQQDQDSDGDGFYDWEEEIAGTNSRDEHSVPNIPHTRDLTWQEVSVQLPRPGQTQDSFASYRQAFEGVYESLSGQESDDPERAHIESVSWQDNRESVAVTIEGEGFSPEGNVVYVGYELAGNPIGIKGFTEQSSPNGTRINFSLPKGAPTEVASAVQWDNYALMAHWVTVASSDRSPESNQVSFSSPIPLK